MCCRTSYRSRKVESLDAGEAVLFVCKPKDLAAFLPPCITHVLKLAFGGAASERATDDSVQLPEPKGTTEVLDHHLRRPLYRRLLRLHFDQVSLKKDPATGKFRCETSHLIIGLDSYFFKCHAMCRRLYTDEHVNAAAEQLLHGRWCALPSALLNMRSKRHTGQARRCKHESSGSS
eukprot:SAG11_NODE_3211_length_2607_cov_1.677831_3_plen_176_part_00